MTDWELKYKAERLSLSPATENSLTSESGRWTEDCSQTADAAFTIECLDILLADDNVLEIHLKAVNRPEHVPFNRDNGKRIPEDDLQVSST